MNLHKGDTVMHWAHGIGQIVNLEERALSGSKAIYYVVQVRDMTVWVPADSKVESRLRPPTPKIRVEAAVCSPPCCRPGPRRSYPAPEPHSKWLLSRIRPAPPD